MDIAAMKLAAEAATPGPWTAKDTSGAGLEIYADVPSQLGMAPRDWPTFSTAYADVKTSMVAYETWVQFPSEKLKNVQARNAVFIAAANPAAVLELIASHDELVRRACDVLEGLEGMDLPGALPVRIEKLRAALSAAGAA